ncbi:PepSY domain-containing protein [Novosphingobium flavum]|uniref:PepSY domain-containing protein n=1 Tax=Novosphingobium flavum TaxID=1778672 RepID=A0A7X1FQZ2_9SPHN|nr:PepSY-associated TM helix domain-containing protein [Novosphingobium flavum]MBC2665361.1 PepSY domain-containing protein [Novosphingobium flavum]
MLRWHRMCAVFGSILILWVVLTGTGIQLSDMRALLMHAPASDPDMQKMRQWHTGPGNFVVLQWPDYTARPLPSDLNPELALRKTADLARAAVPGAPMKTVELRMAGDTVAGYAQMGDKRLIFDLASGMRLPDRFLPLKPITSDFGSPRQTFKKLHRFVFAGTWAIALGLVGGLAIGFLIVTGSIHFYRLWRARKKIGRASLFWKGGSWWRVLHRWISVGAGVLIVWLIGTGIVLSANNVGQLINLQIKTGSTGKSGETADVSSPIQDADIASFTAVSLAAFNQGHPGTAMKVLRLRYYAGYAQAVIIAADKNTSQLVYNAKTGAPMTLSEPGYPDTYYPTGWEGNQVLKRLHRGDSAGMLGRWLVTLAALSVCYLSISGVVIYLKEWRRRRKSGRGAFIWK